MRAAVVTLDGNRATVRLIPSWLARMFGSRVVEVELVRHVYSDGNATWRTVSTGSYLGHLTHGHLIRNALDFREVAAPVPARLIRKEQG